MTEAKVTIPLANGSLQFEGSEEFVTKQLDKFAGAIELSLKAQTHKNEGGKSPAQNSADISAVPEGLEEIFAETENGVQILIDIPGDSKSSKTVNAAKLLLYGLTAFKKKDIVFFEEVADVCRAHGFYDVGNMSSYLKSEKSSFIFGGSGKKQTLKLTVPGSKAAAQLIAGQKADEAK